MSNRRAWAVLGFALLCHRTVCGAELRVAVASNFFLPAQEIATEFTRSTGHPVVFSRGSTGTLFAQITQGAPFDVLLSADRVHVQKLADQGLGVKTSAFTYATGKLILWSALPDFINDGGTILETNRFKHLAVANPRLAPYGRAAREVLSQMGLLKKIQPRLVLGENVLQTFHFVSTQSAELGFISLSQVYEKNGQPKGSFWMVPQKYYSPIDQDGIILTRSKVKKIAEAFLAFLKSNGARSIIENYGYSHGK